MTDVGPDAPADRPRLDAASAEAAAARLMAMHVAQQEVETLRARGDRKASTWLIVGLAAAGGVALGAVMGAARGHAAGGALVLGLSGALVAALRERAL